MSWHHGTGCTCTHACLTLMLMVWAFQTSPCPCQRSALACAYRVVYHTLSVTAAGLAASALPCMQARWLEGGSAGIGPQLLAVLRSLPIFRRACQASSGDICCLVTAAAAAASLT